MEAVENKFYLIRTTLDIKDFMMECNIYLKQMIQIIISV